MENQCAFITFAAALLCQRLQQDNQRVQSSSTRQDSIRKKKKKSLSGKPQEECVFNWPQSIVKSEPKNRFECINPSCECEEFVQVNSDEGYYKDGCFRYCIEEELFKEKFYERNQFERRINKEELFRRNCHGEHGCQFA